jgi:hypothetical protein
MADYPISNVERRIVYTGSAGVGPYAFPFEVLTNTDINVYKNDTLLTLTTNYTVTISPTLGTGSITLVVAATGSDRITIIGARAIQRTTDFTTGGDFFANTLNDEMDSQTILTQQVAETAERSIKAPVTDPTTIDMTLPNNTTRASKFLSFDANGNPQALNSIGTYKGNWASGVAYVLQDIIKDTSNNNIYICITAHTSTGSQPISSNADVAKWSLLVDSASASTSASNAATSASNAATSASNASSSASSASSSASTATTQASNASTSASNAATSATNAANSFDSFDDRYLGSKASAPSVDNDGNALLTGALYWNSSLNQIYVWSGSAWNQAAFDITGTGVASFNTRGGAVTLTSTDVTNALTFTPISASSTNTLTNKTLTSPVMIGTLVEDVFTITDAAGFAIDPDNGSIQLVTLGANRTPTVANFAAGEAVTLMIDDGTARTITWTTIGVVWVGGTAPTLSTSGYTVIELWRVGSTYYGALVGNVA